MNHIEESFRQSDSIQPFARAYFRYLKQILDSLDLGALETLQVEFEEARRKGRTLFVAGNGGSAATAGTMANDLGFDVLRKSGTDVPFKVLALTDNTSVITAMANDVGYENIFLHQLEVHYRPHDRLLVISASGNSENLVRAAGWVKARGGKVLGLLGFTGGKLKDLCDVHLLVPSLPGEYGPVEDVHLIVNHVLAHWFQNALRAR